MDGAILVVDTGRTRAHALQRASEALALSKTKVLGAVLNKLTGRGQGYYYYSYHYYSSSDDGKNGHRKGRLFRGKRSQPAEETRTHA